jgi:hypothetical protein
MTITENTGRLLLVELRKLNASRKEAKKSWVKVSVIRQMTGWTTERLRRARENGEIQYKKDNTGFWYNIDTLNPVHIKSSIPQRGKAA